MSASFFALKHLQKKVLLPGGMNAEALPLFPHHCFLVVTQSVMHVMDVRQPLRLCPPDKEEHTHTKANAHTPSRTLGLKSHLQ